MTVLIRPEITPAGTTRSEERPTIRVEPGGQVYRRLYFDTKASEPGALPDRLWFGGPVHPGLRLRRPVPLDVRREEGTVIVSSDDLEEFGSGQTLGEAVIDFSKGLAELYFSLEREHDRLGSDLSRLCTTLHEYVVAR